MLSIPASAILPGTGIPISRSTIPVFSHDTFIRIKEAYDILVDYCINYEISFGKKDIRNGAGIDSREIWMNSFGDDPIWD